MLPILDWVNNMASLSDLPCLCNSKKSYAQCCEKLHLGTAYATTPEQLMRSRYTAYAIKNAEYIYQTYANEKQQENPLNDIAEFAISSRFINLEIVMSDHNEYNGIVEFCASYFYKDLFCKLHEKSRFIKEENVWKYLDGEIFPTTETHIGRNDTCPCGSGKKYKKCHMNA